MKKLLIISFVVSLLLLLTAAYVSAQDGGGDIRPSPIRKVMILPSAVNIFSASGLAVWAVTGGKTLTAR